MPWPASRSSTSAAAAGSCRSRWRAAARACSESILRSAVLEVAELHALEARVAVDYRAVAAEDLALERPGAFDAVTCMEMLEHVPDPAATLAALAALVKPGGDVIVSTLNRNPLAFAVAIVGAEYIARVLPRGTHEYLKFIRPSELARWGRAAGPRARRPDRHHLQPADAGVPSVAEHRRQLPCAFSPGRDGRAARAGMRRAQRPAGQMNQPLRAILFDLDGTLARHGAGHGRRAELSAPRTAASSRCPSMRLRSSVSHGSARLVRLGFPDADAQQFAALQRRFLRDLPRGLEHAHAAVRRHGRGARGTRRARPQLWASSPTSRAGSPNRCSRSSGCASDSRAW